MKTPREILLERHRAAAPKLDAVRRNSLAAARQDERENPPFSLRDFLWPLRWHLAGMSAVWFCIVCLNLNAGHAPGMVAAIPRAKIPSPEVIIASLRENRRQLSQMMDSPQADAEQRKSFVPKPRSEWRGETLTA